MADKGLPPPPGKRSRMVDDLAPNANLRISRTPVNIRTGAVGGTYWSPETSPFGGSGQGLDDPRERINIATPEGGSGMDALGVLKHEALHQFFHKYPDAEQRLYEKVLTRPNQGDVANFPPFEVGPHALVHDPREIVPQDFAKYVQQSLLDVAQGPEQQRHMRALVSMIPPEALTQQLRDRAKNYYNAYQPDIQRSLQPPPDTPAAPAPSGISSILNKLLGR